MKFIQMASLIFYFAALLSIAACSTAPYTEDAIITGTVAELITKEKFFIDDKMLLVKELGGEEENVYEIPVDSFKNYEVGQKVEVVVYSNTDADVWDPDNMKFEITVIE